MTQNSKIIVLYYCCHSLSPRVLRFVKLAPTAMYTAGMGVVRTCVDVQERLRMHEIGTWSPCSSYAKQRFEITSCPKFRGVVLVEHLWNNRFGEGRNLKIMSEGSSLSRENSLSRKGSLRRKGSRLLRKLSKRDGDDVLADLAESVSGPSSFTLGAVDEKAKPEHLVILVNGIAGSALNWEFAAEQFKLKLADKVVVHCSSCNSFWKTFDGVDTMGDRLAEEVMKVVEENRGLKKISIVGHSLGGLIARYAIGKLYAPPGGRSLQASTTDSEAGGNGRDHNPAASITHQKATIAGLEPINFITLATPHLGCRGNQHLPFLFGLVPLERVAPLVSHWFIGKTGRHLFLADGTKEQQPLLERMVQDCGEFKFLSALGCFKRRTAYANVGFDHMVGWRTSSIRKAAEMPERLDEGLDSKYPHVVREEAVSDPKDVPALDDMEEVMVAGLQQVLWWRVDVNFSKARPYFAAHNLIQVKFYHKHSEGADVIHHIIDKHF